MWGSTFAPPARRAHAHTQPMLVTTAWTRRCQQARIRLTDLAAAICRDRGGAVVQGPQLSATERQATPPRVARRESAKRGVATRAVKRCRPADPGVVDRL